MPMEQHESEIRELLAAGRKIEAIRLYRERYGVGLKEAKDAVEAFERGAPLPPAPSPPSSGLSDDPELAALIDPLLREGRLIQAIKEYRHRRPVGLKEAKEIIEARASELGPEVGSVQPGRGSFGCPTLFFVVIALGWFIYHTVLAW
jgi:ribosomal protein L7/L12